MVFIAPKVFTAFRGIGHCNESKNEPWTNEREFTMMLNNGIFSTDDLNHLPECMTYVDGLGNESTNPGELIAPVHHTNHYSFHRDGSLHTFGSYDNNGERMGVSKKRK